MIQSVGLASWYRWGAGTAAGRAVAWQAQRPQLTFGSGSAGAVLLQLTVSCDKLHAA